MFLISEYQPSAVQYHEPSRGVFVRWETKADTKSFGHFWLLEFPVKLNDVVGISFTMGSCLNASHPAVVKMLEFANQTIRRLTADQKLSGEKRDELEEGFVQTLFELPRHMERDFKRDSSEQRSRIRERFARIAGTAGIAVPDELV
jgi:hypothetical protein